VLLVDDSPVKRRVMLEQMHAWHLRADTAPSAAEALAALRAAHAGDDPYHIALIDYHMPHMDGVGLAKVIKADPALRYTTLVLLTSTLDKNPETLGHEGGFTRWLVKPIRPSALFDALISVYAGQTAGPGGRAAAPGAAPTASSGGRRFDGRVLVADDNTTNQRVAQLALEGLGCHVEIAGNGVEALAALQQRPFDLILMDCEMPEMDGFEATSEIRAREARRGPPAPRTPIVAMTAKVLSGDREKCLAAGMDDYLSKPVHLDALVDTLTHWLPVKATPDAGERPAHKSPAPERRAGERRMKERRKHARPAAPYGALDAAAIDRLKGLAQATTPALFAQVLEAYQADAARYIAALQDAAAHDDRETLRRTGHALKGASLNVGATALADMSLRLETVDEPGGLALPAVPSLLARLASEFARVQTEIERELAQERARKPDMRYSPLRMASARGTPGTRSAIPSSSPTGRCPASTACSSAAPFARRAAAPRTRT
jgi:CheY-like chemotaxis protein